MDKKGNFGNIVDFSGLMVKLASPEDILSWSYGEITKPETINYRTLKPEKDGLFDERIFGPTKDWECYCGKYKRIRYKGIICDKCGVEVTQSKVRRERMGHIKLAAPVAHVWFFKGSPSKMSPILDLSPKALENVIYFASYLVTDVDKEGQKKATEALEAEFDRRSKDRAKVLESKAAEIEQQFSTQEEEIKEKIKSKEARDLALEELRFNKKQQLSVISDEQGSQENTAKEILKTIADLAEKIRPLSVLSEDEYLKLREYDAASFFKVGMGAECILEALKHVDLGKLTGELRKQSQDATGQKKVKAIKSLRVVEGLKKAGIDPSGMILSILPVIPPDLRPMVQLTGGKFATSDLNDLYRRVINRNNRLKHLIELGAPEIILRNEKRMLQEAVDSLIDASQRTGGKAMGTQTLRSLSDMLRGKQGRFRQNLLGKRVDYSGRSVIVVGPELTLSQCGLPKEMALELFKPFVLRELIVRGYAQNVKNAKNILEKKEAHVFDILEEITKNHPVLLNRAPTLHKLGIQAFYPILIEGAAIRIHPCVCAGYNADFDGDQMAVHVPLSQIAQDEAKALMLPVANLLKPADGGPITIPNKEMALGCYYITSLAHPDQNEDELMVFSDEQEVITAFQTHQVELRQKIKVRVNGQMIVASPGRVLFNEVLPQELRFFNEPVKAAVVKALVTRAFDLYPKEDVAALIDKFKSLGFWGATIAGGVSVSVFDNTIIPEKKEMVGEAEEKVKTVDENYQQGLITNDERKRLQNEIWIDTTERLADATWGQISEDNPVKIIINSGGARASKDQLKQLSAIKGLVVDPLGKIVELPTKSNYREGLSIFEYVTSTRGSRKGLTDSALKTADAGYLTRRLIDVAHDAIIRAEDCGTTIGIEIHANDDRGLSLEARCVGRILAEDVLSPKTKKVILPKGSLLLEETLPLLKDVPSVNVRSPFTCELKFGLCAACYGIDLSTKKLVELGTPVGIVAAQSIGEPGTQLTMRVRHAGGIVGLDVTQGLPRVEELFEMRTPKIYSPIAEIPGKVTVEETEDGDGYEVLIKSVGIKPVEERIYHVAKTAELRVKTGDLIGLGDPLTTGPLDIKEMILVKDLLTTQVYLLTEIQRVYQSQGIPIHDKHFEVIIRKMCDKVRIETPGDTTLLTGEVLDKRRYEEENGRILAEGGEPATAQVVILGITRAALFTESWLSAASFQETTTILTDAALCGKEDRLLGLKENVIIGRLIPVSPERARLDI